MSTVREEVEETLAGLKEYIRRLELLVREGDRKAYRSLKLARKRYRELQKELRRELKRERDMEWEKIVEAARKGAL